jgi:hypothetical protein
VGLESHSQEDWHTAADASLKFTMMIGLGFNLVFLENIGIVMLTAAHLGCLESLPNSTPLTPGNCEERIRKRGFLNFQKSDCPVPRGNPTAAASMIPLRSPHSAGKLGSQHLKWVAELLHEKKAEQLGLEAAIAPPIP